MGIGKQSQWSATYRKKSYRKEPRCPVANCWQNKVKTVTLPCEFGTGFFPHLDKGPLIKILQVWMQLSSRALAQYALGPGMSLSTKNKQQTHKQANQFMNNFAKDLPKPYQCIMSLKILIPFNLIHLN